MTPNLAPGPAPRIRTGPLQAPPQPSPPPDRRRFLPFLRAHKAASVLVALALLGASVGVATLLIRQDITATPAAHASPVVFAAGSDAASLDTLGYLDNLVIPASGASASLTIYGVPGATSVSLGKVLNLESNEASGGPAYDVTLSSTALPAGVTSLVLSFVDDVGGTPTPRTWTVGASTPTYELAAEEVWEFSAVLVMPASGALSAITISADITPA